MFRYSRLLFFLLIALVIYGADGSRILISAPFGTKSHKNMYVPLVRELIDRQHQVTIITNYETTDFLQMDNVTEIVLDQLVFDMSQYPNAFDNLLSSYSNWVVTLSLFRNVLDFPHKVTEAVYSDPRVKKLIADDCYHLVIGSQIMSMVSAPFAWHFQAPFIVFSPNKLFPGVASLLGDNEHTSYVPFIFTSYTDRMTLWQRAMNTVLNPAYQLITDYYERFVIPSIVHHHGLQDCPPLQDIVKNVSLVFTNTHPTFTYPRTLPPSVIEVGAIHCRPSRPLSVDLETFVSVPEGFLLFGVGSLQQMEDMPEHLIQSFIQTFARLPLRVIWQWKGKIRSDLPRNVYALPWLPQQDLLGHIGCRAFITHGGLNSLQEAIYHGVPVLGLPFGLDHHLNLVRAVNDGYALKLEWKEINQQSLSGALEELLYNRSYITSAKRMSNLLRDQIETPLERAVYWTEYVIRHNGAEHLRLESRNLALYQRALVDVYALLFFLVLLPFLLVYVSVRCFKCVRSRRLIHLLSLKKIQ